MPIGVGVGVPFYRNTIVSGGGGVPAGTIQAEDATYLEVGGGNYLESESGIGGKISTYPTDATPDTTDHLVGIQGGAYKRFTVSDVADLAYGYKTFMPRGVRMCGDTVFFSTSGGAATFALNVNYIPFFVPEPCSLTLVTVNCSALEAGSLCRLGLYTLTAVNSTTNPTGALVADFGTVSGASTGDKSIVTAQPLTRGWYCYAAACSNHSAVRWRRFPTNSAILPIFGECTALQNPTSLWRKVTTDYSGGLPANIDATSSQACVNISMVEVLGTFT